MKTLLFVVGSATSYRLQRIFAQYCVTNGRKVVLVYDQPPDALFAEVEQDARLWGTEAVSLDTLVSEDARPTLRWWRMPHPVRAWLFAQFAPAKQSIHRRILGARLAAAQALLTRLAPAVVIVSEDGISGPAALIAAARSLKLPVVDLPYGYGTQHDLDVALEEKASHNELIQAQGGLGRLLRLLAPAWVKKGRFAGALIFPMAYIAAREALGMTLRNAWIVHGGYADRLLVESDQMMDLYRAEGQPRKKLALTGTPYCDVMFSALQSDPQANAAFRAPQPIGPDALRVLVSWPTSYHASRAAHCEFVSYEEMSKEVLGWLHELPGCQLTVSLHPAIQGELRAGLEGLGLNIVHDYVIELIPRHDIYISYFSSTQRWAIACGKPVVNYDAYQVGLNVYDDAPGFFSTARFEDFKRHMIGLTSSRQEFTKVTAEQIAVAARWGIVDGACMARMLAELDRTN